MLFFCCIDPTRKKNPANLPGYTVNTIWGEMAYQLVTSAGRPDLYAIIRDSDRKGVSPGSENLKVTAPVVKQKTVFHENVTGV